MANGEGLGSRGQNPFAADPGGPESPGAAFTVLLSASGELFLCGEIDDQPAPLRGLRVVAPTLSRTIEQARIGRFRTTTAAEGAGRIGLWATAFLDAADHQTLSVECMREDGQAGVFEAPVSRCGDEDFDARLAAFAAQLTVADRGDAQNAEPLERLLRRRAPATPPPFPKHNVEAVLVAEGGGVFVVGWIDDALDPLREIVLAVGDARIVFEGDALGRTSREDAHIELKAMRHYPFGFWGFASARSVARGPDRCRVDLTTAAGARFQLERPLGALDRVEMRNFILSFLGSCRYLGNPQLDSVASVSRSIGRQVVDLNRRITGDIVANPYVERFGRPKTSPKGSIIVCLYGKPEYLFLQTALFSGDPGIEDYEFLFVSNSPELAETLLKQARVCAMTFDIDLTLIVLPGNAGFGAANNAAAKLARSERLLIVNPDVFPYDRSWAAKHTSLVESLPARETRLFGAPLFYDDGSLMHSGLYFETDTGVSLGGSVFRQQSFLRVEHYGKGAPPDTAAFLRSRPVPAVTGAFISCAREWFEKLGGFCEDYVFGHYEDADLCLRSLEGGTAPWIHDLKLWHLEGKGSVRPPTLEGAVTINRWLFNSLWATKIVPHLLGRSPKHPLLRGASEIHARDGADLAAAPYPAPPQRKPFAPARDLAPYRDIVFAAADFR